MRTPTATRAHPGRLRRVRRPALATRKALALASFASLATLAGLASPVVDATDEVEPVAAQTTTRFLSGENYVGQAADPTVLRLPDGRYLASTTTTANLNLPLMTSRDLEHWTPRQPLSDWWRWSDWRRYNESMLHKPTWAATRARRGKVALMSQWAPDLALVRGRYLAAYSAAIRFPSGGRPRKSCIGIASASNALGQYRDRREKPLVCFRKSPRGSIDPDIFVGPGGTPWLIWKNEGIPNTAPPKIVARRLNRSGTGFPRRSRPQVLIKRDRGWEGGVVENPSMIKAGGTFLLFYSGNSWRTERYATGWAVCNGPAGPCRKPSDNQALTSGDGQAGPGGASAFYDDRGQLRLAYHAYDEDSVGPGKLRRLNIGTAEFDGWRVDVTER